MTLSSFFLECTRHTQDATISGASTLWRGARTTIEKVRHFDPCSFLESLALVRLQTPTMTAQVEACAFETASRAIRVLTKGKRALRFRFQNYVPGPKTQKALAITLLFTSVIGAASAATACSLENVDLNTWNEQWPEIWYIPSHSSHREAPHPPVGVNTDSFYQYMGHCPAGGVLIDNLADTRRGQGLSPTPDVIFTSGKDGYSPDTGTIFLSVSPQKDLTHQTYASFLLEICGAYVRSTTSTSAPHHSCQSLEIAAKTARCFVEVIFDCTRRGYHAPLHLDQWLPSFIARFGREITKRIFENPRTLVHILYSRAPVTSINIGSGTQISLAE